MEERTVRGPLNFTRGQFVDLEASRYYNLWLESRGQGEDGPGRGCRKEVVYPVTGAAPGHAKQLQSCWLLLLGAELAEPCWKEYICDGRTLSINTA